MFSFFTRSAKRRTAPPLWRRPSCRPMLEALEDRCLLSSGGLDPTFGSGGTVTTALTNNGSYGHGVLLQPNGDLIEYGIADTATKKTAIPLALPALDWPATPPTAAWIPPSVTAAKW